MIEIIQFGLPFIIVIMMISAFGRLLYLNHKSKNGIFYSKEEEFLDDWKSMPIDQFKTKYKI